MDAGGLIELAARHTVARMLERDDFPKRYKAGKPIAIHEFLYPLVQGYDSVALQGRRRARRHRSEIQPARRARSCRSYGQEPQVVITMPLLEGLDGVNKMSKSLGNYIGIAEPPDEMFGKLMSHLGRLMWRYFELLSFARRSEIERLQEARSPTARIRATSNSSSAQEIVTRSTARAAAEGARRIRRAASRQGRCPTNVGAHRR